LVVTSKAFIVLANSRQEKRQHDHAAPKTPGGTLTGLANGIPDLLSSLLGSSSLMKANKAIKTQVVEPKFRKEAKRLILTWGPYKLAPPKVRCRLWTEAIVY
jgi:hypothetical protein